MLKSRIIAYINIILNYMVKIVPVNKKYFYFCSFHGQYSDSPRYLSVALHNEFPDAKIIWEISPKSHESLPDYVISVVPNSIRSIIYRSRSKVIIDNYLGWAYGYAEGIKLLVLTNLKKKTQFNVCTWHGTPLKKIGIDMPSHKNDVGKEFYSTSDLLVCGNKFTADILTRHSFDKIPISMCGMPRNDILFSEDFRKSDLLDKLRLPHNKKIFLFAPTFRDELQWSGIYQLKTLNISKILEKLSEKFKGDWIFVFRAHDSVLESEDFMKLTENNLIYSGNVGDDMAEYLYVSDILLTDYSSSMFDYVLTKRPCFLYCPDRANYESIERGFYMDMDQLPYPQTEVAEELYKLIEDFDLEKYNSNIDAFLNEIGNIEEGVSTKQVVDIIKKRLR